MVRIYRNGSIYFEGAINEEVVAHNAQAGILGRAHTLREAGTYQIVLITEGQGVRFSEVFELRIPMSGLTVFLIILVIAIVVGGAAVFIHLRTRMRVR